MYINFYIYLLSGSGYVTISLIIPLSFGLYRYLNSLNDLTTEEGRSLCEGLIGSIRKRLFPYENMSVAKISTLLDPRFKKEGFRSPVNAENASSLLDKEMSVISKSQANHSQDSQAQAVEDNPSSPPNMNSLLSFVKERILEKSSSLTKDIIITKRHYLERPNILATEDPLLFWKVLLNDCIMINYKNNLSCFR